MMGGARGWPRVKSGWRPVVEPMERGAKMEPVWGGHVQSEDPGGSEEMKTQSNSEGLEGHSGAKGACDRGRDVGLAERYGVGATEDSGERGEGGAW